MCCARASATVRAATIDFASPPPARGGPLVACKIRPAQYWSASSGAPYQSAAGQIATPRDAKMKVYLTTEDRLRKRREIEQLCVLAELKKGGLHRRERGERGERRENTGKGGISLTPAHTSGSIVAHGRLPKYIDGIGAAVFIGRCLSGISGGSSMAARICLSAMSSS